MPRTSPKNGPQVAFFFFRSCYSFKIMSVIKLPSLLSSNCTKKLQIKSINYLDILLLLPCSGMWNRLNCFRRRLKHSTLPCQIPFKVIHFHCHVMKEKSTMVCKDNQSSFLLLFLNLLSYFSELPFASWTRFFVPISIPNQIYISLLKQLYYGTWFYFVQIILLALSNYSCLFENLILQTFNPPWSEFSPLFLARSKVSPSNSNFAFAIRFATRPTTDPK